MDKPVLTYDKDCAFCKFWVERWKRFIGDRMAYRESAVFIPAVILEMPDGKRYQGAEAAFEAKALAPGHGGWRWCYRHLPGFAAVSEWCYRFIAAHRPSLWRLTKFIYRVKGPDVCGPNDKVCRTRN